MHGLCVAATVEGLQIEVLRGAGLPQPQEIDGTAAVADDGRVPGLSDDFLGVDPLWLIVAAVIAVVLDASIDRDVLAVLRASYLPGVTVLTPGVGVLDLLAVFKILLEDAELVIDTVAHCRVLQRCQRVEETGRQAPKPAVAQAHVDLFVKDICRVLTQLPQCLLDLIVDLHADHVIDHQATHQVLKRQVVGAACVGLVMARLGIDVLLQDAVANGIAGRQKPVPLLSRTHVTSQRVRQVVDD